MQFLQELMVVADCRKDTVVYLLHALGNTGCECAVDIIVYMFYENDDVKLVAVNAVRKSPAPSH